MIQYDTVNVPNSSHEDNIHIANWLDKVCGQLQWSWVSYHLLSLPTYCVEKFKQHFDL